MGSGVSANHEWIELQNTSGSSVDMSGWTLSDGLNLSIPLSGTVEAGAYAVLERTSDDATAGTAFLIYTGALVNTGATLKLTRADGGLEDQVSGGENWQAIGGDNVTKETAQYTTGGWVTGVGTPGMANAGVVKPTEDTSDFPSKPTSSNGSKNGIVRSSPANETVRLTLPGVTLALAVTGQRVGYVNQPIEFLVTPSGVGDGIANSLVYEWNFGDGTPAGGKEVVHSFRYPGTYVVTVYGLYKRQEQVARHEITILPVDLSLTRSVRGDIQISNDSPYEIDMSKYRVSAKKTFTFPSYSVLLPNQTITLPRDLVGAGFVVVRDTASAVVVSELPVVAALTTPVTFSSQIVRSSYSTSPSSMSLHQTARSVATTTEIEAALKVIDTAQNIIGTTSNKTAVPGSVLPYIGLIGTILVGLVGTGIRASRNQNG
jgi:hypothetical protein